MRRRRGETREAVPREGSALDFAELPVRSEAREGSGADLRAGESSGENSAVVKGGGWLGGAGVGGSAKGARGKGFRRLLLLSTTTSQGVRGR